MNVVVAQCARCRCEEEEEQQQQQTGATRSGPAGEGGRPRAASSSFSLPAAALPPLPPSAHSSPLRTPRSLPSTPGLSLRSPVICTRVLGPASSDGSGRSPLLLALAAADDPAPLGLEPEPPADADGECPPLRRSSSRKRTYSFSASPHVSPRLLSQKAPASQSQPQHADAGGSPRSPQQQQQRRTAAGRALEFGREQPAQPTSASKAHAPAHGHGELHLPPSVAPAKSVSGGSVGASRRPASSPPPSAALFALTHPSHKDPLPLSAEEILLEEEEEDLGPDSVVEEAGEQRQWRGLRGFYTQATLLLTLGWRLLLTLGFSAKWMRMLARLIGFSIALAPAWLIIGRSYFRARFIKRGVRYGLNARNFLDIYLPHQVLAVSSRDGSATPGAAGDEPLCDRHRAEVEAERKEQSALRESLPLAERLHLDSLVHSIAAATGLGPESGRDIIDANAMRELNAAGKTERADTGTKFAAAITSNAQQPAPNPSQTASSSSSSSMPPPHPRAPGPQAPSSSSPPVSHVGASGAFSPPPLPSSSSRSSLSPALSTCSAASSPPSDSPPCVRPLAPVVVFITGGAWSIGYKAWGALLGLGLSAHGVLVVSVDYRNFPQGDIGDMGLDVQTALTWCFRHIESYGGDPQRMFLAGQSAGAHLGALAVLNNCEQLLSGKRTSWTAAKLRGFIGISGPYDLGHIKDHLDARGLPRWVFKKMMRARSDADLARYSPARLVQQAWLVRHMRGGSKAHAVTGAITRDRLVPPFLLIHGKGDKTVHWQGTDYFAKALHAAHVPVAVRYYKNYSHTDPIIEGPLTGHDHLAHDILFFITQQCEQHRAHTQHQQQRALKSFFSPEQGRGRTLASAASASSGLTSAFSGSGSHQLASAPSLSASVSPPPLLTASKPSGALQPHAHPHPASPPRQQQHQREGLVARKQRSPDGAPASPAHSVSSSSMRVQPGTPADGDSSSASPLQQRQQHREDGIEADGDVGEGDDEHHQLVRLISHSPVPRPPSTLSSLLSSIKQPLSLLPDFMLPRSVRHGRCARGTGRGGVGQRQSSHLPHPLSAIDDVEERMEDLLEDAFDFDAHAASASPSPSPVHGERRSPGEALGCEADYCASAASRPLGLVARVVALLWLVLGALVPGVVSRTTVRVAAPFVRILRASPPPTDSPRRSPSTVDLDGAAADDASAGDAPTTAAEGAAQASLQAGSLGSGEGQHPYAMNGHLHACGGGADAPPTPVPSSPADRLSRQPRHRYSYPLQKASQLPSTPPRPLIPRVLIRVARWINPF